mgnify:CR=1 FL=1
MGNSPRAGRAIGAMFFSVFGSLWNLSWAWQAHRGNWILLAVIAIAGLTILTCAIRISTQNAGSSCPATPESKRSDRYFHLINFGQWIVINLGKAEWVVMSVIFIVGLHFIPMARLFNYAPHYALGVVIMLWSVSYPKLADGPADPIGALGMGLLLWSGAVYALHSKTPSVPLSV